MVTLFRRPLTLRAAALIAAESLLILSCVCLAAYLRLGESTHLTEGRAIAKAMVVSGVCQICLYYADLYDLRVVADRRELFLRIAQSLGVSSLVLAALYYWIPSLTLGRGVFMIAACFVAMVVVGWRITFEWASRRVAPRERLLLIGTTTAAVELARELFGRRQEFGIEIVGFIDPDPNRVGQRVFNPSVVGTIEDIPRIIRERNVDRVVVSLADARGKLPMDKLLELRLSGVSFNHLASVYEAYTGKIALENLRPSWFVFADGFLLSRWHSSIKRAIDLGVALVGLVAAAPIMCLVAAAVKLTSRGPILYHQQRVGHNDRPFVLHKFRSMQVDAEERTGAVWASANDPRVTPCGRFLRVCRLDELPQLWNVLRGDMSLVGPRPERRAFVDMLAPQIPYYRQRHVVKPGLTGWAQVRYTYGSSVHDALEKLQYDLFYIKNMSLRLDLYILAETAKTMLLRRGA